MSGKDLDFYANKTILAPMVRGGRCPLRNLVLEYGADLVYTEELIDEKLLSTKRIENEILQTTDYMLGDELVLRISKSEKPKCVLQVGSCCPEKLVSVCKKFSDDVAAIDINMGCPKSFSCLTGRGAALLSKPELVQEMISSVVNIAHIPISCKIRVLNTLPETIEFANMLEKCGISALGVHGRRREERPKDFNRFQEIREVARALSIPVIANGESSCIDCFDDIAKSKEKCGASSIMIARKGLSNPSIFRSHGLLPMDEEIYNFLGKACILDEDCGHTKYVIQRILGGDMSNDERGRSTIESVTMLDVCKTWGQADLYNQCQLRLGRNSHKRKIEKEDGLYKTNVSFPQKRLKTNQGLSPKCHLAQYCINSKIPKPVYETIRTETGKFISIVTVDDKRYTSTIAQSNKRLAEQVGALAALYGLNLRDKLTGTWDE